MIAPTDVAEPSIGNQKMNWIWLMRHEKKREENTPFPPPESPRLYVTLSLSNFFHAKLVDQVTFPTQQYRTPLPAFVFFFVPLFVFPGSRVRLRGDGLLSLGVSLLLL